MNALAEYGGEVPQARNELERANSDLSETELQQAVNDAITYADEQIARQEGELRKTLQDKGMTVIEPDLKAFSSVVLKEVPPKFADKWKPGLLDEILKAAG